MGRNTTKPAEGPLGIAVRTAREGLGLYQNELAAKAGLSSTAISDIESGVTREPDYETIRKLENILELPLNQYIGRISYDHIANSLSKFLQSPHAEILELTESEISKLGRCIWFGEDEEPSDLAWQDFVRAWRQLKRK